MLLNILNCSPRGERSNTRALARPFVEGFMAGGGEAREYPAADPAVFDPAVEAFGTPSAAMIAFPLYADAMPAAAKAFIEEIWRLRGSCESTRMLFLVHSGFPEETHTRVMKDYLERLAARMGSPCDGVIRVGGGEAARHANSRKPGKTYMRLRELGRLYAERGVLDAAILAKLAGPRRLPWPARLLAPMIVNRLVWDRELRRNGAFDRRRDRPLEAGERR